MNVSPNLKTRHSNSAKTLALLLSSAALWILGCESTGSAPQVESPAATSALGCLVPVRQEIRPLRIEEGRHLIYSLEGLDFLADPSLEIRAISLSITFQGKIASKKDEPKVGIAGFEAGNGDGPSLFTSSAYNAVTDVTTARVDLTQLRLNGGLSFKIFLALIKLNQGTLKVNLTGPHINVLAAVIVFEGRLYHACPTPTPSPTPTPTSVAPDTQITSVAPSQSPTSQNSVVIAFKSNQERASFKCSLDGAESTDCVSPQSYSGLASGGHYFKVTATNSAGLRDPSPAIYQWMINASAPGVSIINASTYPSITNSTSISLAFASPDPATVGFQCSLDGAALSNCAQSVTYPGLAEGTHSFSVVAVNSAGNLSTVPAVLAWTVDLTSPSVTITQANPSAPVTSSTSLDVSFAANETAALECAIDGASFSRCTSPLALTQLADGAHELQVRATDIAGNTGLPATYDWIVDTLAPTLTLGNTLPAPGLANSPAVSVDFQASEASTFECSLDGAAPSACASPFTATITSDGAHLLVITATDLAGNVSAPATVAWDMDFTIPSISFGRILPSAASTIASQTLSAEILNDDPLSTTLTATLDGVDLGTVTSPVSLAGLADGGHLLSVTATDRAGNASVTITHAFAVDLTAPVVSLASGVPALTNLNSNTLDFSADEPAAFECDFNGAGFAPCASPDLVAGLVDGTHVFTVRATDVAGNASAPVAVSWTVDRTAPTLTGSVSQSGSSLVYTFVADDSGAVLTCSLDGAAFQACSSPASFSGLSQGAHSLTVRAADSLGNVDLAGLVLTGALDLTAPALSFGQLLPSSAASIASRSLSAQVLSNDASARLSATLDGSSLGTVTSPILLAGLTDGPHSLSVTATDSFGNVSSPVTHSFVVDVTAPIATLTSSVPALTNSTTNSLTLSANELSTFQCSLDGAAFAACTTPASVSALVDGAHSFRARAIDAAGNVSAIVTASWAVDTVLPIVDGSVSQRSSTLVYDFYADKAGTTFTCSLDGGATAPCSATVTYSGLAQGNHSLTVIGTDLAGNSSPIVITGTLDLTAPVPSGISTTASRTSITVTWTTNETSTGLVYYAKGNGVTPTNQTAENTAQVTSHSITVSGLLNNSFYSLQVGGRDVAGNMYRSALVVARTLP